MDESSLRSLQRRLQNAQSSRSDPPDGKDFDALAGILGDLIEDLLSEGRESQKFLDEYLNKS